MKLELFYVVRPFKGGTDSIGRSADCSLIAGPFKSWTEAWDAQKEELFSDSYDVVKQVIEVEL
jgi:hypothetical protein